MQPQGAAEGAADSLLLLRDLTWFPTAADPPPPPLQTPPVRLGCSSRWFLQVSKVQPQTSAVSSGQVAAAPQTVEIRARPTPALICSGGIWTSAACRLWFHAETLQREPALRSLTAEAVESRALTTRRGGRAGPNAPERKRWRARRHGDSCGFCSADTRTSAACVQGGCDVSAAATRRQSKYLDVRSRFSC